MRLLLCDDDPLLRDVLASLVADQGHEVVGGTDDAEDAVDLLGRFRPDLAIVDLALRRGSGLDVVRAALGAGVGVVVFSAFASELAVVPTGAVAVAKPDFAALEAVLHGFSRRAGTSTGWSGGERRAVRIVGRQQPQGPIQAPEDFYKALGAAWPGDALLAIAVEPDDPRRAVEVASVARSVVRGYDNVTCRAGEVLVLLAGCGASGAVVAERIIDACRTRQGLQATLVERHTEIDAAEAPSDALRRVRSHLKAASVAASAARLAASALVGAGTVAEASTGRDARSA